MAIIMVIGRMTRYWWATNIWQAYCKERCWCVCTSVLLSLNQMLLPHPAIKGHYVPASLVVGCWHGYLSGARCRLAHGPVDATVSCFSKVQIGFTFLVLAHPGSPGKGAVKRVCVCVAYILCSMFKSCQLFKLSNYVQTQSWEFQILQQFMDTQKIESKCTDQLLI